MQTILISLFLSLSSAGCHRRETQILKIPQLQENSYPKPELLTRTELCQRRRRLAPPAGHSSKPRILSSPGFSFPALARQAAWPGSFRPQEPSGAQFAGTETKWWDVRLAKSPPVRTGRAGRLRAGRRSPGLDFLCLIDLIKGLQDCREERPSAANPRSHYIQHLIYVSFSRCINERH